MKANKHEINGYIYVTSEGNINDGEYYLHNGIIMQKKLGYKNSNGRKIILTNRPKLSIQQLTPKEIEYLKVVDSCEVENEFSDRKKIIIPKHEPSTRLKNSLTQFNISLEEVVNLSPIELKKIGFGNRSIIELQYLISENETNFDEWFEKRKIH